MNEDTLYQGGLTLDTILSDLDRIAAWLAEDVGNDEAQGAASDLHAVREWLLGNLGRTLDL